MKVFKKLISVICVMAVIFSYMSVFAKSYSDLNVDYECYYPVMRLSDSKVINGYEDNTYRPWNNVTRAEFCKIVVAMTDKTKEAESISTSSPYDDVNKVKWCVPYVNYLTTNNIIKGYADATFKPNNVITYAEAVTILCRVLGYNEESVGYSWPANYIKKAEDLKLAENMNFGANDPVTRATMAIMVDNAMFMGINNSSGITPVRATKNYTLADNYIEGIKIDYEDLTVYKNNKTVTVADIKVNDVVYYDKQENTMDVYDKKVTGIYNEAIPSKAYVTSVNVGGNIYSINSKVDTSKLDASQNSFKIGERVTLLLGENDEVCFAVELSDTNSYDCGILIDSYKETSKTGENEGSSQTMVKILMGDGKTYEYKANSSYSGYVGDLVRITYNNGYVSLAKASYYENYGEVNLQKRTIGGKTFLKDGVIFNRISDDDEALQVEVIDFEELDVDNISKNQVIASVSTNAFGDIAFMYVCDMPGSYQFGLLRNYEPSGNGTSGVYTIYSDSKSVEYQSDIKANISGAVAYRVVNGRITDIKSMKKIASGNSLGAVDAGRIMINSTIYTLSDNVEIIDLQSSSCRTISVNELANNKVSNINLYLTQGNSSDASVRLITVTLK